MTVTTALLRLPDRVYGEIAIDDPRVVALIRTPTFERLKRIKQAGPSAFVYPFKTVTRYEHSLGVYELLRRLGASEREQIAGLLHDISHTAFSHAVDFVIETEEQDLHESLKPLFLGRPDVVEATARFGFKPDDFLDDSIYPLLEQPLPGLCADRLDYFLRDGLACGVVDPAFIARMLAHLKAWNGVIVCDDVATAREAAALFAEMNRVWWSGPIEAYIYNEFAEVLRAGFRRGAIDREDLLGDDDALLAKLRAAADPEIERILETLFHFDARGAEGYLPRVEPKRRWIDPPVLVEGRARALSELS